jgi:hypothetical protein
VHVHTQLLNCPLATLTRGRHCPGSPRNEAVVAPTFLAVRVFLSLLPKAGSPAKVEVNAAGGNIPSSAPSDGSLAQPVEEPLE